MKQLKYNGIEFNIFDIGGQNSLRQHWKNYYEKTDGIVWVIDSTDQRRLVETGIELQVILKDPKLSGIPLLIMANKQDLATAMRPDKITEELNLHSIRDRHFQIQKCSALRGFGVDEGMNFMAQELTPPTKEQIASKKAQEAIVRKEIKQQEKEKNDAEKKAKQIEKSEKRRLSKTKDKNSLDDSNNEKGKKKDKKKDIKKKSEMRDKHKSRRKYEDDDYENEKNYDDEEKNESDDDEIKPKSTSKNKDKEKKIRKSKDDEDEKHKKKEEEEYDD